MENDSSLNVGLRLNTHHFVTNERAELVRFSIYGEGGQLGCAEVFTVCGCSSATVPRTGYNCSCAVECARSGIIASALEEFLHTLEGYNTSVTVPGIVYTVEFAIVVCGPFRFATGSEEEGCSVPSVVLKFEVEEFTFFFANSDDAFQGLNVFFRENALVIVQKISVVGSKRISVLLITNLTSLYSISVVVVSDFGLVNTTDFSESAGLNQSCQLVLCEAVEVGSRFNVSNNLSCSVAFTNTAYCSIDNDAGVCSFESVNLGLGEGFYAFNFTYPNFEVVGTGNVDISSAGTGSGSGCRVFLATANDCEGNSKDEKNSNHDGKFLTHKNTPCII